MSASFVHFTYAWQCHTWDIVTLRYEVTAQTLETVYRLFTYSSYFNISVQWVSHHNSILQDEARDFWHWDKVHPVCHVQCVLHSLVCLFHVTTRPSCVPVSMWFHKSGHVSPGATLLDQATGNNASVTASACPSSRCCATSSLLVRPCVAVQAELTGLERVTKMCRAVEDGRVFEKSCTSILNHHGLGVLFLSASTRQLSLTALSAASCTARLGGLGGLGSLATVHHLIWCSSVSLRISSDTDPKYWW